jgi:hypothetical protein
MKGCYHVARSKVAISLRTAARGRSIATLRPPKDVR